ncbi:Extracellular ligand-binding receptor [Beggiatoa sp. PS]|nr:Extracellular ligand-binding receptor [Beggiatoa sp. PS]
MSLYFNWLHLTDFHQGMEEQGWQLPGVKNRFFEDLARLHEKCGPWDLVLFTGDLTQRGSPDEFEKFNDMLSQLWEQFKKLGSEPKLLAVPGNHDLERPKKLNDPAKLLLQWNDNEVKKEFLQKQNSPYRRVVNKAFKNYTDWFKNQPFKPDNLKHGLLPGDFSVTIEKGDAKLGIIGLNTSFFQLTGDNYEGKLLLHTEQFHKACDGDGPAWAKQHQACLLMTHHPPTWLNPESLEHLNGDITDHGRFAVHLCGHLHEANSLWISEGGAEPKYIWQSRSLFGLEYFFEKDGTKIERSHGYTVGKIELKRETGTLTFLPRRETRLQGGEKDVVPEYSIKLTNEHTIPKEFQLLKPYHDIFVSYASADNQALSGTEKGWVNTLITGLKNKLGTKLGRDNYSLWIDDESRGNGTVPLNIMTQLENSAILVVILSHHYLASSWCQEELSTFLAKNGRDRVFIVERNSVPRPKELNELVSYPFGTTDELDYQKLGDLARDLSQKVTELTQPAQIEKVVPASATISSQTTPKELQTTLFLAKVSDDLEEQRDEVKNFLEQQGLQILPNKDYPFDNIKASVIQDLKQCQLFVQLLSDKTGNNFPQSQYEWAKKMDLPIMQWHDRALDINQVQNPAHKELLSQDTVIASTLVEFQEQILNELKPKKTITKNHNIEPLVFVNAASEDMVLSEKIQAIFKNHKIGYAPSLKVSARTPTTDIEKYLKTILLECDAVIVLYDRTSVDWVTNQVLYCRRMQGLREQPFKVFAVCDIPSSDKQAFPMYLPYLQVLECPTLDAETALPEFIRILKT